MKLVEKDFVPEPIRLNLSGLSIDFIRIYNHQELVNRFQSLSDSKMEQAELDKLSPYWARLWHGSIALGEYLVEEQLIQPGMKVIELGCGLGLAGVVASKLGGEVIFTDYDPNALIFAKKNWELNSTTPACFELMDWNHPNPDFAANVVLGADIAYGPNFRHVLLQTFDTVCKPGGTIVLSDPMRSLSKFFYEDFESSSYNTTYSRRRIILDGLSQTQRITKLVKPV